MKKRLFYSFAGLLAALVGSWSAAADLSCTRQIGAPLATLLAQQCRQVSPATHPPCNAANSCAMVVDEIERGCAMVGGGAKTPPFCTAAERPGTFEGYLLSGGGTDAVTVTVLTDKGERIAAYCTEQCDKLLSEPDEHEVVALRRALVGRRVAMQVAIVRNAGGIPGPGDDERIPIVKRLQLLK